MVSLKHMYFNVKDDLIEKAGYSKLICGNVKQMRFSKKKSLQRNWNYQDNLLGHLEFVRIQMTKMCNLLGTTNGSLIV